MKSLPALLALFAVLAGSSSLSAGDSLFYGGPTSLGKAVLQSNHRLARNWFLEVTGGPSFGASGDFTRAIDTKVHGHDAWLASQSFDDIFDNAWLYGLRFGKRVGDHNVYFRFSHTTADADRTRVGGSEGSGITANFSDYSDFAVLFGIEREFLQPGRLHPYVGVEAGFLFTSDMDVSFTSPAFGTTERLGIYDETVTFTAALTAGIAFDVTDSFQLGIESGVRYQGAMDEADADLADYGLKGYNASDGLIFVPLLLTGSWYF